LPDQSVISRVVHTVTVAGGRFAPGHLGELTRIVPFEMVDAALAETGRVQSRVRALPSRVVYLLLAAALFAGCGYRRVGARLTAGLDGLEVAAPSAAGLAGARRRVGAAPLRALLDMLRGPAAGPATRGVWWHGWLLCALDGTTLCCPDTPANLTVYCKGGSHHGGTGFPMVRLVAVVACGTRALLEITFGAIRRGEPAYAAELVARLRPGMLLLADRNFAAAELLAGIRRAGADLLIRIKAGRRLPVCRRCGDGSWISRIGGVEVRVIRCALTLVTPAGRRREIYQLVTTVTDPACPATDLVGLYHQRWEIETAYLELKQSLLAGRVLRARTPAGLEQEIYALLLAYQALRIAITDATLAQSDIDPDRGSFTVALNAARDQVIRAAGVLADSGDLIGVIGRQVLNSLLPARRCRSTPRVVKRAISNYVPKTKTGRLRGPSYPAAISIDILAADDP
jgi:hypothetical protein